MNNLFCHFLSFTSGKKSKVLKYWDYFGWNHIVIDVQSFCVKEQINQFSTFWEKPETKLKMFFWEKCVLSLANCFRVNYKNLMTFTLICSSRGIKKTFFFAEVIKRLSVSYWEPALGAVDLLIVCTIPTVINFRLLHVIRWSWTFQILLSFPQNKKISLQ